MLYCPQNKNNLLEPVRLPGDQRPQRLGQYSVFAHFAKNFLGPLVTRKPHRFQQIVFLFFATVQHFCSFGLFYGTVQHFCWFSCKSAVLSQSFWDQKDWDSTAFLHKISKSAVLSEVCFDEMSKNAVLSQSLGPLVTRRPHRFQQIFLRVF